jgi:hypothetical protein
VGVEIGEGRRDEGRAAAEDREGDGLPPTRAPPRPLVKEAAEGIVRRQEDREGWKG